MTYAYRQNRKKEKKELPHSSEKSNNYMVVRQTSFTGFLNMDEIFSHT